MPKIRLAVLVAAPLLCQIACGSAEPDMDDTPPQVNNTPPSDTNPPEQMPRCALPYDVRAIDKVATGTVAVMAAPTDPTVFNAEIDATAGGSMAYGDNPFVYVDLIGRKKVDITDVQAPKSGDWDIAFKRWQIKVNSGDSGPGYVLVSRVDATALDEVKDTPPGPYYADSYFDAKCHLIPDAIGGLGTALSDWYDYDMTMGVRLVPKKEILVFTRRDGQGSVKLQILSYYKGMTSGYFSLSWSYLP